MLKNNGEYPQNFIDFLYSKTSDEIFLEDISHIITKIIDTDEDYEERTCILLFFRDKVSNKEISRVIGKSYSRVSSIIQMSYQKITPIVYRMYYIEKCEIDESNLIYLLDIPQICFRMLKRNGIYTIKDLLWRIEQKGDRWNLSVRGIGEVYKRNIMNELTKLGFIKDKNNHPIRIRLETSDSANFDEVTKDFKEVLEKYDLRKENNDSMEYPIATIKLSDLNDLFTLERDLSDYSLNSDDIHFYGFFVDHDENGLILLIKNMFD